MNKNIEKLIKRDYPFIVYKESETAYYILSFIDIENCYVQGETLEEVMAIKDQIKEKFLKRYYKIFKKLPDPTDLSEASGKLTIRLPKSIILKLKQLAKIENISINKMLLYIITNKKIAPPYYFKFDYKEIGESITNNILLRIPKTLHKKLQFISKIEGISINQYLIYQIAEYFNELDNNFPIKIKTKINIKQQEMEMFVGEDIYEYKTG